MQIIRHRRNTIEELKATPTTFGVEVDIRSEGSRLLAVHDPFLPGVDFEAWLAEYKHGTLILNTKEEGLEERLLHLMAGRGISDFFFLDQSFPFLIKTARGGEKRCAVRVSEYESVETALNLKGLVDWVWIDYFTRFPLSGADMGRLRNAGLKTCLVSPELQGYKPEHVNELRSHLKAMRTTIDAVCTKMPELWAA